MGGNSSSPSADASPSTSDEHASKSGKTTSPEPDRSLQGGGSPEEKSARIIQTVSRPSYCKEYGKDKIIFLNREDWDKPPTSLPIDFVQSLGEPEEGVARGVILPNGEINWGCPCLGNLAYGPCALPFRDAFSCFHYSLADPKGSDCIDYFRSMTECMARYPRLYPQDDDDEDENDAFAAMGTAEEQAEIEKRAKDASPAQKRAARKKTE